MGLEILPYLEGDEEIYPIVELTNFDRWMPEQHTKWCTTLHTQLDNSTLNRIVDKEYQVNETISIDPANDFKDDVSVNTHTTANSSSLTDTDLELIRATTLQTYPDLFDPDNNICFAWDDMDK